MLIAPVGTRDLRLTDLSLLPDEALRERWFHADPKERTGAWQKGEMLTADLDRYAPALRMEILGKAVRHVYGVHNRIDRLVLVASRQPDTADEEYRKNDSFLLACAIKELLLRDKTLHSVGQRTKIMLLQENPASYEGVRAFYREHLPAWTRPLGAAGVCYLEVTGGTAQMSTMLLLEGVRLLRTRAVPLYVLKESDMPQTLEIGREMLVDALRQALGRDLGIYASHAACRTVAEEECVLRPSLAHYDALLKVLDSTRHRLNFDFDAARRALFGADRGLPPDLSRSVHALATELGEAGRTPEWLIAEVYHSAVIRRRTEAYAGFVGRVFRFQEAMLRYLCESWGARFGGAKESFLDQAWLARVPDLVRRLERSNVDVKREVTRRTLRVVAEYLGVAGDRARAMDWLRELDRLEQVASLRNQLVITHGFEGVSAGRLAGLYKGGAEQIEREMAALIGEVLGIEVSASPYEGINELCLKLLEGAP